MRARVAETRLFMSTKFLHLDSLGGHKKLLPKSMRSMVPEFFGLVVFYFARVMLLLQESVVTFWDAGK